MLAGEGSRNIPSLDGLRAVAIALVLVSHEGTQPQGPGYLGVAIFFVISGFLITRLLLRELNCDGRIRLGRFYRRRALRIFPAFYVYVLVIAGFWLGGVLVERGGSFAAAATYSWNYYPHPVGWNLAHFWSLSLEEQFYLLWPAWLWLGGRRWGGRLALTGIMLGPASRVATYFLWPAMRNQIYMMLHTRLDTILMGCALALWWDDPRLQDWLQRHYRRTILPATAMLLIVSPALRLWLRGGYDLPIGYTLDAALIALLMAYLMQRPGGAIGRILNSRLLCHVGVLSYSLYIWQQLFMRWPHGDRFPLNLVLAVIAAEISLRCVERPALRWRERLEWRPTAQALAAGA